MRPEDQNGTAMTVHNRTGAAAQRKRKRVPPGRKGMEALGGDKDQLRANPIRTARSRRWLYCCPKTSRSQNRARRKRRNLPRKRQPLSTTNPLCERPLSEETPSVRLDVWLWRARFFKTRSLSSAAISKRDVRVTRNGQTRRCDKPSTAICPGDVLTFTRARNIEVVEILDLGTRRGPASEAERLYEKRGESGV